MMVQVSKTQAAAFRRYVEPEIEVLLRVALTLTSASDAEDLVQETLVRAWRSVDGFDGRHPRAWLLTIMRNTNINMHRRQRPDVAADVGVFTRTRPAFGIDAPGTEEAIMTPILSDDLERAVDSLDAKFRTVLVLIDVDQLTYSEAAGVLGVPIGTVMSRLSRARSRVRQLLRPSFDAVSPEVRR